MSYKTLMEQLDRIHRHTRQGSIQTRRRYYHAMRRFLHFVSEKFKLQKIANISDKHLLAYVAHLRGQGHKSSYILTELAAIRYYHDQLEGRYRLTCNNAQLNVERRERPGDRAWTEEELAALIVGALDAGKPWMADVLVLGRELGARIHEITRLSRADAERALREGVIRLKGKGGLVREVHVTEEAQAALHRAARRVSRGAKLFVPPDKIRWTPLSRHIFDEV